MNKRALSLFTLIVGSASTMHAVAPMSCEAFYKLVKAGNIPLINKAITCGVDPGCLENAIDHAMTAKVFVKFAVMSDRLSDETLEKFIGRTSVNEALKVLNLAKATRLKNKLDALLP